MPERWLSVERLERIAHNAILGGYGTLRPHKDGSHRRLVHMDLSMDCDSPVGATLHARYSGKHGKAVKPLTITMQNRCRRCAPCKERKAMFWKARAFTEYERHFRTFFGTLTLRPEIDAQLDAEAVVRLHKRGVDFYALDPDELFRVRVKVGGELLTDWLKRVREAVAYRDGQRPALRYLLIAEPHNGAKTSDAKRHRPHWHVLLHEDERCSFVLPTEWAKHPSGQVIRDKWGNPFVSDDALLRSQWNAGQSRFQLATTSQAATYLCKYISKAVAYRVRASQRYGLQNEDKTSETIVEDKGPARETSTSTPVELSNRKGSE